MTTRDEVIRLVDEAFNLGRDAERARSVKRLELINREFAINREHLLLLIERPPASEPKSSPINDAKSCTCVGCGVEIDCDDPYAISDSCCRNCINGATPPRAALIAPTPAPGEPTAELVNIIAAQIFRDEWGGNLADEPQTETIYRDWVRRVLDAAWAARATGASGE